ncbi:MAG TPA: hypothetical protein VEI97_04920, partial [bacterium]|nr:hypothetical protein [bacterium]
MPNLLTRTARPSSRLLASGSWLLALGFCLLAAFLNPARASHAIGSDLHYVNVGPGLYLVTYRFYRDCSGIAADTTSVSMSYQATGCGTSGTGTNSGGSMQLPKRGYQDGNPYCRAILMSQPPCDPNSSVSSGSYPNHQVWSYAGIVNLGTG